MYLDRYTPAIRKQVSSGQMLYIYIRKREQSEVTGGQREQRWYGASLVPGTEVVNTLSLTEADTSA